jgi:sugar phosphate isomerase/epimerase
MTIMNDEPAHSVVNANICERLLPVCQEYDVIMALEVHGPGLLDDGGNDDFLEAVDRTGIPYAKLMLDFSCCLRDDYPNNIKWQIAHGANPACIELVREYRRKANAYKTTDDDLIVVDWEEMDGKLKALGAGPVDLAYARRGRNKMSPPKVIKAYASRLCYVHGKVNWLNEDCTSDEMDYPLYIRALQEGGYKGYISTELEGQRVIPNTVNEVEQVRRHHILLRNCLGY